MKIKVMHVLRSLIVAGMEHGVVKLVNGMDRARFEPSILCLVDASEAGRSLLREDVPVFELGDRPQGINVRLIRRLARTLREEGIDVVHSHNWGTFLYANLAARLAGRPVLVHGEHGRDTRDHESGWKRDLVWNVLKGSVGRFVAVSENIAQDMAVMMKVPREKIVWIPNGVDTTLFRTDLPRESIRRSLGFGPERRIAGTVGWLREVKDHETLIRAFFRVKESVPESVLMIIGKSPDASRIGRLRRMAAERGLEDTVLFLGERTDIPELLSAMDVYVNSSVYEGMSNTILEAMACGKPVVATRVGGNPMIVEDGTTGILVPPRDEASLADAVLAVFNDAGRAAGMGEAGRRRVESRHSMTRMIDMNQDLYRACLGAGSPHGAMS